MFALLSNNVIPVCYIGRGRSLTLEGLIETSNSCHRVQFFGICVGSACDEKAGFGRHYILSKGVERSRRTGAVRLRVTAMIR